MVKTVETLVSDIYELLEGKALADPSLVSKFGHQIGEVLIKRLTTKDERKPTLRMSNIGKPLRQLWYELNGTKGEELSGKTHLKFTYGDLTEALLIALCEAAGHKVERLQEEIEIDGIKGHIDCVIDGVLFDIKSCSAYSFRKFQDGSLLEEGNDPFGYKSQLCGYREALGLPAAWLAFDKQSGEICILHLPEEEYDVRGRIAEVRATVSQSSPPERCYPDEPEGKSGNRKLSVPCSYCAFKFSCWDNLKVYAYSTGPKFLTVVEKEPKVFQIKQEEE